MLATASPSSHRLGLLQVFAMHSLLVRDLFHDLEWGLRQILQNHTQHQVLLRETYGPEVRQEQFGNLILAFHTLLYMAPLLMESISTPSPPPASSSAQAGISTSPPPASSSAQTGTHGINPETAYPGLNLDEYGGVLKTAILGEGSQGVVYGGVWLGNLVAVKEISSAYFDVEMDVLKRLKHPNVVDMKGYTTEVADGKYGLVMELMDCTLQELVEEADHPFSLIQTIDMLLQIARGMRYLHDCGVMHRDLKPANVLVRNIPADIPNADGYLILKLADFGLSKPAPAFPGDASLTFKAGTRFYMAPEARDADKVIYSKEADVFSFGTTCFNVVTGVFFDIDNLTDFYHTIERDESQELLSAFECPLHLATLIRQCWAQTPASRPTYSEICGTLELLKEHVLLDQALIDFVWEETPLARRERALGTLDRPEEQAPTSVREIETELLTEIRKAWIGGNQRACLLLEGPFVLEPVREELKSFLVSQGLEVIVRKALYWNGSVLRHRQSNRFLPHNRNR